MVQLNFDLKPSDPYSPDYFVSHSGVAEALGLMLTAIETASSPSLGFSLLILSGSRGSGRTHMCSVGIGRAVELGVPMSNMALVRLAKNAKEDSSGVSDFVSLYEGFRTSGGIIFVISDRGLDLEKVDPHVRSRLSTGRVLNLEYPTEEELRPVLRSMLERRNLSLSDFSLDYLLRRLPRSPLSFDSVFARLSEESLSEGAPAGLKIIRRLKTEDAPLGKYPFDVGIRELVVSL